MSTVIELDLGAGHEAHAVRVEDKMVCVLAPQAATDVNVQQRVRRLMQSEGVDCRACRGCPVGTSE